MATAKELRELADSLEAIEKAEAVLAAADEVYRANKDDDNAREHYKKAAQDLTLLRDSYRRSGLQVSDNIPGSTTVAGAIARQSAKVVNQPQKVGE
jgi:hypothetical protein